MRALRCSPRHRPIDPRRAGAAALVVLAGCATSLPGLSLDALLRLPLERLLEVRIAGSSGTDERAPISGGTGRG